MQSAEQFERRAARRYELNLGIRYITYGNDFRVSAGTADVVNLSTSGLLMRGVKRMVRHHWIKAAIDWPAPTATGEAMFLIVAGYVARTRGLACGVVIEKHDFIRASVLDDLRTAGLEKLKEHFIRPVVLIDEDTRSFEALAAMMRDHPFPVYSANDAAMRDIVTSGFPPLRMIITDTMTPFADLQIPCPVIHTGTRASEVKTQSAADMVTQVRLSDPSAYLQLRSLIPALLLRTQANPGSSIGQSSPPINA